MLSCFLKSILVRQKKSVKIENRFLSFKCFICDLKKKINLTKVSASESVAEFYLFFEYGFGFGQNSDSGYGFGSTVYPKFLDPDIDSDLNPDLH
jgi:hypothetical protein